MYRILPSLLTSAAFHFLKCLGLVWPKGAGRATGKPLSTLTLVEQSALIGASVLATMGMVLPKFAIEMPVSDITPQLANCVWPYATAAAGGSVFAASCMFRACSRVLWKAPPARDDANLAPKKNGPPLRESA